MAMLHKLNNKLLLYEVILSITSRKRKANNKRKQKKHQHFWITFIESTWAIIHRWRFEYTSNFVWSSALCRNFVRWMSWLTALQWLLILEFVVLWAYKCCWLNLKGTFCIAACFDVSLMQDFIKQLKKVYSSWRIHTSKEY